MASIGKQSSLELIEPPKDMPAWVLRKCECEADAVAISMEMHGGKLAYYAEKLKKSEGYVSRLRSGERSVPPKLVDAICRATENNLLRQYIESQEGKKSQSRADRLKHIAREALRHFA